MSTTTPQERRYHEQRERLASREYRNAFRRYVRQKHTDADLRVLNAGDTSGSHATPDPVADEIATIVASANPIRRLARVVTYAGTTLSMPTEETLPEAAYLAESGDYSGNFADGTYGSADFDRFKLAASLVASEELVNDAAFDFEAWLLDNFGRRLASTEEDKVLNGTGTNEPTGLISQIGAAAVTTALPAALAAAEVQELFASLGAGYVSRATWLVSPAAWVAIISHNVAGAVGMSLDEGAVGTLYGRPVHLSDRLGGLEASATPILFGDFSRFIIWDANPPRLLVNPERFIDTGQVLYRMFTRHDAKLVTGDAIVRLEMSA